MLGSVVVSKDALVVVDEGLGVIVGTCEAPTLESDDGCVDTVACAVPSLAGLAVANVPEQYMKSTASM